jgi:hypothetical protein
MASWIAKTENQCWNNYVQTVNDYWSRLTAAGGGRNLLTPFPSMKLDVTRHIATCVLGGNHASAHSPMASSEEVADLLEAARGQALFAGGPPIAAALAAEDFRVAAVDGGFELQTHAYKYTVLYKASKSTNWQEGSSAIRFESDSAPGYNSWLLNHPVHHIQPGNSNLVRIRLARPCGIVGFVDWFLRAFAEDIWAEMYPELYLALSTEGGSLHTHFGTDADSPLAISDTLVSTLERVIRGGRADSLPWFRDLQLWNRDIELASKPAPELLELFERAEFAQ